MIDKVSLCVDKETDFTPEFAIAYAASRNSKRSLWVGDGYYASAADFREYGYDMRLSTNSLLPLCPATSSNFTTPG